MPIASPRANAEGEIASRLARTSRLTSPAETRRAPASLFAAPGSVHVTEARMTIALQPTGTKSALRAFDPLLRAWNR